jgi:hypothetical protein
MSGTSEYRFRVSDVANVPLRGMMLRLRLLDGEPNAKQLRKGGRLRLQGPDGVDRTVTILGNAAVGGKPTQARLDEVGEVDVIVGIDDALKDDTPVAIGWEALGPVS